MAVIVCFIFEYMVTISSFSFYRFGIRIKKNKQCECHHRVATTAAAAAQLRRRHSYGTAAAQLRHGGGGGGGDDKAPFKSKAT